jgi:NAD(P)-dependent dehydrogenase (short-subunit alcohol dehydrogenase family)
MKKTILITGATDGIGKETAKNLAVKGNHIILHGRDENKVYQTKIEILNQFPKAEVDTITADFSALANVKRMAETISENFKKLDVLINNAGVYSTNKSVSQDGFELSIAVNYLAVYVLTNDLLDLLIKSKPSRIINVSSIAHKRGRIELDQFTKHKAKDFDAYKAYADSKLMLIYYTYYLADELMDHGVTVNALHPGVITTKMLIEGFNMTGEDVAKGAETPVYLATSPNVEGVTGKYFDKNIQVPSSRLSYDQMIREEVMHWTADVLKKGGWMSIKPLR